YRGCGGVTTAEGSPGVASRSCVLCLALMFALGVVLPASVPVAASEASYSSAGRQQIAPGVVHDWGTASAVSGGQRINIVELEPDTGGIQLETSLARDRVTARERTTAQALRHSREGHRVVATVNGGTFASWPAGHVAARGLNVRDGELLTVGRMEAGTGPILSFAVDPDGRPIIGMPAVDIQLTLPDGSSGRVDRVNQGRLANEAVLYTPRFDSHTWTDALGDEYIIEGAALPLAPTGTYSGTVVEVRRGQGDAPIRAGQLVLSATGTAATRFSGLAVGNAVSLSLAIEPGWEDIVHAVGGRELLVRDGAVEIVPYRLHHVTPAHPRTAVGITAGGRVILVTVDGRSSTSGGLTLPELAEVMLGLGAVSALNLDGGGSTTMAVRDPGDLDVSIVNTPSDGTERTVATALQVVSRLPTGPLAALRVSPPQATLYVGQEQQYAAKGHDASFNAVAPDPARLRWSTSGTAATISSSGLLRAVAPGESAVNVRLDGISGSATVTVRADDVPPLVSPPVVELRPGVRFGKAAAKLQIGWTATDPPSGIARVDLQQRVDGGAWQNVMLSSTAATKAVGRVGFGRSIQFRARATDGAGNRSQWVVGSAVRPVLYDERAAAVVRAGTWKQRSATSAIAGQYARSKATIASSSLTFSGLQVAWIGLRGPSHGRADVYLDGAYVGRVNLNSSSLLVRRALFVSPLASPADAARSTTILVRNAGTATRPIVDLDAFVVLQPAG
ncbi:MAG: phosphodiester glycosidase family protein, partial [Chloroflexota bacterium]|nr:phosphodiester glycosidase family protein [Chloroflexota bacterium]